MTKLWPSAASGLLLFLNAPFAAAHGQGTAFMYQGQLQNNGSPANGSYDISFSLFTAEFRGTVIAGPVTNAATAVSNGVFTTTVDFGPGVFTGGSNWLQIAVSTNGANSFTALFPRQPLTPVPYALWAGTASNLSGTVSAAQLSGTIPPAQLPATMVTNGSSGVTLTGNFSGNGAGLTNIPGQGMAWQTVTGTVQAQSNEGYIATDTNLVTITLPASPNVGDIIRVSGAGTGGWTIAQNAGQMILGASFSAAAPNAIKRASSQTWTAVASSASGSNLVACSAGQIWLSSDAGVTWTAQGKPREWTAVASSTDGTRLAAASTDSTSGGLIYTSSDSGATWAASSTNDNDINTWTSIASSADGTNLVATANGYTTPPGPPLYPDTNFFIRKISVPPGLYRSHDSGVHWTLKSETVNSAVASSADGTNLVAVGNPETGPGGALYTSKDAGNTWKARLSGTETNWISVAISADGTKMAATQSPGQVWTSTDSGTTWTATTQNRHWTAVAWSADGTTLAAAISDGEIYMSWNSGLTWAPCLPTVLTSIPGPGGLALSADGSKLVAVDNQGFIWTFSENTTAGTAGHLIGGSDAALELQYIGNNQFRPLSFTGGIYCY